MLGWGAGQQRVCTCVVVTTSVHLRRSESSPLPASFTHMLRRHGAGSHECPHCIKEMVGKLDALEDELKQRAADIKALKDAHDDSKAREIAEEEEAQKRAAEAADAMRAREDEIKAREDEMRTVHV
jgi:uncharacterized protein YecA (UPF0149 family)